MRRAPAPAEVARAVAFISSKRRPLVICGGGVRYSGAERALEAFCAAINVPFGETQAGKGVLPWDNPFNLGGIGVTGSLAANTIARDADLVIGIGTRLGDFTTASKWLFRNPKVAFLTVNANSFDAHKMGALPVIADAKATLEALTKALTKAGYRSAYTKQIRDARARWAAEVDRLYAQDDPAGLSQTQCLGELNERLLPKDAIVIGASGSLPGDLQRVWRPRVSDAYHMEYGFSCMGYEIAAALGAKMAAPDREVFAFVGDGSYVMLHSELLTSIMEGRKINVVVFDNHGFQCIDNLQTSQGIASYGNEWRLRSRKTGLLTGDVVPVDFARNGESYGARGFTVRTLGELRDAVRQALREARSTVIDVKVTPKSMTGGYDAWWRVGTAAVSRNRKVVEAARRQKAENAKAKAF